MSDSEHQNFISVKRITFSERFEKTRLAILSYSAIAIVLSVASNHSIAQAPGVAGVHINIAVVRILVLLAAASYVYVFWKWDVPATRTLNSNALDGVSWSELKGRFHGFEQEMMSRIKITDDTLAAYDEMGVQFGKTIRRVLERLSRLEDYDPSRGAEDLEVRDAHHDWQVQKGLAPADRLGVTKKPSFYLTEGMKGVLAEMKGVLDAAELLKFPEQSQDVISRLEKVQSDQSSVIRHSLDRLQHLSASLLPGEATRFRVWDCGAAYVIFWLAAVMTILTTVMYTSGYEFIWNVANSTVARVAPPQS